MAQYYKDDTYTKFFRLPKALRTRTLREFYITYKTDFKPNNKKHMMAFLEIAKAIR